MDSFLASDSEDEDNQSDSVTNTNLTKAALINDNNNTENAIEQSSEENESDSNSSENESTKTDNFTLDDIDWNKVSQSMGDNVEIIAAKDPKHTPPLLVKKLFPVCNKALLTQKLCELQSKSAGLAWFESLTLSTQTLDRKSNLATHKLKNNDIKREIFFYRNTLESVKRGIARIKSEVPNGANMIQRPNDFYAEMIKSDVLMKKIKGRILWEQKKIGIVENRKKNQRLRKYHKKMMSDKIQRESKRKRTETAELEQWKRNINRDDRSLQQIMKSARGDYNANHSKNQKKPNMKRIMKNLRYGSGYVQKGLKGKNKNRNTFSSTNSFQSDWRRSKEAERRSKGKFGGNLGGSRGTKRYHSQFKGKRNNSNMSNQKRGNNKSDFKSYGKNVQRHNRILGKNRKRGSGKRPGKSVRRRNNTTQR